MKFIHWLVYSSANANKYSTTIKGVLGSVITALAFFNIPTDAFIPLVDIIVNTILAIAGAISALSVLFGAIRKVKTTLGGTNAVLNR